MTKKGFTLVELLIVIAIIGILSSIVTVNSRSALDKARRSAAITTAASVLPEIVTCQDDGGGVNAYDTTNTICDLGAAGGHSSLWPSMGDTGWTISANAEPTNSNLASYKFQATATGQTTICCSMASNSCYDMSGSSC